METYGKGTPAFTVRVPEDPTFYICHCSFHSTKTAEDNTHCFRIFSTYVSTTNNLQVCFSTFTSFLQNCLKNNLAVPSRWVNLFD